jgi:hypothetical protein
MAGIEASMEANNSNVLDPIVKIKRNSKEYKLHFNPASHYITGINIVNTNGTTRTYKSSNIIQKTGVAKKSISNLVKTRKERGLNKNIVGGKTRRAHNKRRAVTRRRGKAYTKKQRR